MSGELVAFSLYLRTGRRVAPSGVEVKFNPWHDEENGRFTFAGQGRYFGRGGSSPHGGTDSPGKSRNDDGEPDRSRNRADHPDNYAFYTVQSGDSLSRIAARRKGLTARDRAWLNQQGVDQPLRIGQQINLPHQAYLDRGRAAKNHFLGLAHFMDRHGGNLPSGPSKAPSLESQILDANWKRETKNGYDFHIDVVARNRRTFGALSLAEKAVRSRRNQAAAGRPDRLASDGGGHYIAARFNGPSDSFNHFAQNSNFNRGSYRVMEDGWAKALRAGHKILVDIEPLYHGASKRPYQINVNWEVDGERTSQKFPNEAKGKAGGKR